MKKEELEKKLKYMERELEELKAILEKDSEEYAKELTKESGREYRHSDTWPYKVGVASATIENILEEIKTRRF